MSMYEMFYETVTGLAIQIKSKFFDKSTQLLEKRLLLIMPTFQKMMATCQISKCFFPDKSS